jgi:hypothetical protein
MTASFYTRYAKEHCQPVDGDQERWWGEWQEGLNFRYPGGENRVGHRPTARGAIIRFFFRWREYISDTPEAKKKAPM